MDKKRGFERTWPLDHARGGAISRDRERKSLRSRSILHPEEIADASTRVEQTDDGKQRSDRLATTYAASEASASQ